MLTTLLFVASGQACDETFLLDSTDYVVTEYWCGKVLDSGLLATPEDLVRLPQELTYESYRIYVLPEVRTAFVGMAQEAKKDSVDLIADSGFRSKSFQRRILRSRLSLGDEMATILESVAPPGYSEHHTGRAFDLVPSEAEFAFTEAYIWLRQNAHHFGFIESLPEDSSGESPWESWHWYYTGLPTPVDSVLQD